MESFVAALNAQPAIALFLIVAVGLLFGRLSIKGISFGASGVLFAALLAGHLGVRLPSIISTLGVVLFVYAVGIQAGPRFFNAFKKRGLSFALLALATLFSAAVAAVACELLFDISPALTVGAYTGALTTTPGLAAAREALNDPSVAVGYGIAYPFGILGVVLFVQAVPKILKKDLAAEAKTVEAAQRSPSLVIAHFELRNPQLSGKTAADFDEINRSDVNLTRLFRGDHALPVHSDTVFALGDKLRVVGKQEEIGRMEFLIGPPVEIAVESSSEVETRTVVVSQDAVAGKTLRELAIRQTYGVTITRLFRDDMEFAPRASTTLELGDTIRIAGAPLDCDRFVPIVGANEERLNETPFVTLAMGLLAGVLVGLIPLHLPGDITVKLGAAGGPLLVALLIGKVGRIGPLSFRVPAAAQFLLREAGLLLFLATTGTSAGADFVQVLLSQGPLLLLAAAIMAFVPLMTAYLIARRLLKLDLATTMGLICGAMTSTPGLGMASSTARSQVPAVAYATVYPVALITVTIFAQGLALLLKSFLP
ncbi:MAG: TrkA C-terminal domain-containing protein [Sumerlaeia bacterium]